MGLSALAGPAAFHRERAGKFRHHAECTRSHGTREMYLRLALIEEALAEKAERIAQSAPTAEPEEPT